MVDFPGIDSMRWTYADGTTVSIRDMSDVSLKNVLKEVWQKRFQYLEQAVQKEQDLINQQGGGGATQALDTVKNNKAGIEIVCESIPAWRALLREANRRNIYLMSYLVNYPEYWKDAERYGS